MIYQIVSVHDMAAGAYGRPIYVLSLGQAIRSFQDEVNRVAPDNDMNRHPEDFRLFHLGIFNDATAYIGNLEEGPKLLASAKDMKGTTP